MHKVSIVIPCYNQAQYLPEALQSVLEQTYENWECIIVNDGSPDNTEDVAQEWVAKDARFIYLSKENGGLSSARNAGIAIAQGEFILPLDADDKIGIAYTSLSMRAFRDDPNLKVVYCKAEKFGMETGSWILPSFSLFTLARRNMIFCSAFFRKKDWEFVGGYDVKMIYGLEDWEFWIAMLKNGGVVKCLDEVGFYYRVKRVSMVRGFNVNKTKYLHEYMSIKHASFFVEQLGSFIELNKTLEKTKNQYLNNLKSEKYVMDIFCVTFFKFSVFGLYKRNNKG